MKMFGTIFFACVMFFAVWVILASTPLDRLNRGCTPVNWIGKAITSVAALGSANAEARAAATTESAFYTCRFFWFRQFYRDEYEAAMRARQAQPAPAQANGQKGAGK